MKDYVIKFSAQDEFAAIAIGRAIVLALKQAGMEELIAKETESLAMRTLEQIREVVEMDEDEVGDPECFQRIEKIICAFEKNGVSALRHDY